MDSLEKKIAITIIGLGLSLLLLFTLPIKRHPRFHRGDVVELKGTPVKGTVISITCSNTCDYELFMNPQDYGVVRFLIVNEIVLEKVNQP